MPVISRLSVQAISSKPISVETWNNQSEDYQDGSPGWWQSHEQETQDCGEFTVLTEYGNFVGIWFNAYAYTDKESFVDAYADDEPVDEEERHNRASNGEVIWEELEDSDTYQYAEGPMMNYWYPIDEQDSETRPFARSFNPVDAAGKLNDLPLCVVLVNGEYGLALTGGGMDLTWEICAAFIRLGMAPPLHFCDLPAMAMEWGPREQRVYEGCVYTLEWVAEHANRVRDRIGELRSRMSGGN